MKINSILAAGLFITVSCGEEKAKQPEQVAAVGIEEVQPLDSTGETATVNIGFGTPTSLSLAETPTTLMIGDSIELTMAKFNVAAIKVKSDQEQSDEEKDLEEKEKEVEAKDLAETEDEDENEDENEKNETSLAGKEAKGPTSEVDQDARKSKRDALLGKRDELASKQEERAKEEETNDKSLKFSGPYTYDGITGKFDGDADSSAEMLDGSYRRIEFKLKRNWAAEESDPLFGNVFVIQGNIVDGENKVPFEINYHIAMNFRLRGEGAFKVEAGEENDLSIVFDFQKWFADVDLSQLVPDSETGKIVIDKTSNGEVLRQIRKNIRTAVKFGKDEDGDGKINDEETAGEGEE